MVTLFAVLAFSFGVSAAPPTEPTYALFWLDDVGIVSFDGGSIHRVAHLPEPGVRLAGSAAGHLAVATGSGIQVVALDSEVPVPLSGPAFEEREGVEWLQFEGDVVGAGLLINASRNGQPRWVKCRLPKALRSGALPKPPRKKAEAPKAARLELR